jgi:hypothetical protein
MFQSFKLTDFYADHGTHGTHDTHTLLTYCSVKNINSNIYNCNPDMIFIFISFEINTISICLLFQDGLTFYVSF